MTVGEYHSYGAPKGTAKAAQRIGGSAETARPIGFYRGVGPRGYQRSDQSIYEAVNEHLMIDDELDARGIQVHVQSGLVTLDGRVSSRYERRLADVLASGVRGVKQVANKLRVQPSPR